MNWKAADYTSAMGPVVGKVHILLDDKSRCGKTRREMGGGETGAAATCKVCLRSVETAHVRDEARVRYERENAEREAQRDASRAVWWASYHAYLRTPKWREKSAAVIRRASGVCEACGTARATEAHHVTYDHLGDEPLFDLRAVCRLCHERITEMDRARRIVL